ncbi:MAG: adenylate/guanylate cyclase domain-containing protein [Thaumarchaeota archaeon]|nr:adenylate/guanylate cyclase domain-containing protein [Nitrososphaerota archaeon]
MSEGTRRLAAIMFTDMVGYTALGQRNESLSLALVEEQRKLLRPIFVRHSGREVKTIGDAFLVVFPNALDATRCAYDVQRATREFNFTLPDERKLHLRIGVHLGDVVESAGDISGDAVNVASRIQPLAEDGGVCLTQQVYDHVQGKFELPFASLGAKSLKNVTLPLGVYRMVMPWGDQVEETTTGIQRLAVLPFANMSPDPDDEFFAEGLTEDLITELSGIQTLGVIARTSVMRFKKTEKGIKEIAKDLGVGSVLEGSIRKSGNKIRITAQLIDGRNEQHLWAQRYDRDLDDIFQTQLEIAQSVAKALELKLVPRNAIANHHGKNLDVYTLCIRARSLWNKRTKVGNEEAALLYEEALKLDSESTRALAGLADCYSIAAGWIFMEPREAIQKGRECAARAIELDPTLPEPHATLGNLFLIENRHEEAQGEFWKAISFNPSYASAHQWYSMTLLEVGKLEEAYGEIKKASLLDPLSAVILMHLCWTESYMGRPDECMSVVNTVIQVDPSFAIAYGTRSWSYALKGQWDEALADLETFKKLSRDEVSYMISRAELEALKGNTVEGVRLIGNVLQLLQSLPRESTASPHVFYAIIGDRDAFFKWANWGIDRDVGFNAADFRYNPIFEEIRKDPGYSKLLERFGLSG